MLCVWKSEWYAMTRAGEEAMYAEIKRQIRGRSKSVPIVNNNWRDKRTLELGMILVDLLASGTNLNQQNCCSFEVYSRLLKPRLFAIDFHIFFIFAPNVQKKWTFRVNFEYKHVRKKHLESEFDRFVCTFKDGDSEATTTTSTSGIDACDFQFYIQLCNWQLGEKQLNEVSSLSSLE